MKSKRLINSQGEMRELHYVIYISGVTGDYYSSAQLEKELTEGDKGDTELLAHQGNSGNPRWKKMVDNSGLSSSG